MLRYTFSLPLFANHFLQLAEPWDAKQQRQNQDCWVTRVTGSFSVFFDLKPFAAFNPSALAFPWAAYQTPILNRL